jgi:hypothetical protein
LDKKKFFNVMLDLTARELVLTRGNVDLIPVNVLGLRGSTRPHQS